MSDLSQLLAIGIQAAPRNRALIDITLQSLRGAGFQMPLSVFLEPGTVVGFLEDVQYHFNPEVLGAFANWRQVAMHLLLRTSAPWLMIVQDDVQWRDDAAAILREAITRFRPERTGFLSPYAGAAMVPHSSRRRSQVQHWVEAQFANRAFIGAQALCFPRRTLHRIVAHDDFLQHASSRKIDVLIGNIVRRKLQLPIRIHVPSLAEHVGWDCSTLGRHTIRGIQWARRGYNFSATGTQASD